MKKIILFILVVITLLSLCYMSVEIYDYYNKKNKVDSDKTLVTIDDKIMKVNNEIEEELKKEEEVKIEKKDKIEELELWKKRKQEIIENM